MTEIYDILNESWLQNDFKTFCHDVNNPNMEEHCKLIHPFKKEEKIVHFNEYLFAKYITKVFNILNDLNKVLDKPKYTSSVLYRTAISYVFCQSSDIHEHTDVIALIDCHKQPSTITNTEESILKKLRPVHNNITGEIIDPYKNIRNLILEKVLDSLIYHNPFYMYKTFESMQYKELSFTMDEPQIIKRKFLHVMHEDTVSHSKLSCIKITEYNKFKLEEAKRAIKLLLHEGVLEDENYSQNVQEKQIILDKMQEKYNLLRKTDLIYNEYVTKLEANESQNMP